MQISQQYTWSSTPKASKAVSLLSFSALGRTRNGADIAEFVATNPTDIACLQEVEAIDLQALQPHFQYIAKPDNEALAIAANTPITALSAANGIQAAQLLINDTSVTIVNVHMSKPYTSHGLDQSWQRLLALSNQSDTMILCGDFNSTPFSDNYHRIKKLGFADAHDHGHGFGLTFPHKQRRISILGALIRIDYVFTKGINIVNSTVVDVSERSDHKGLLTTLGQPLND